MTGGKGRAVHEAAAIARPRANGPANIQGNGHKVSYVANPAAMVGCRLAFVCPP